MCCNKELNYFTEGGQSKPNEFFLAKKTIDSFLNEISTGCASSIQRVNQMNTNKTLEYL